MREALRAGRPLERILIARNLSGPKVQEIIDLARERKIPVRLDDRGAIDRAAPKVVHQGVLAFHSSSQYVDFNILVIGRGLLVLLDGVEDPHNLGAIIRTAHAAGASGVIVPERRAAGITDTAAKAGAYR